MILRIKKWFADKAMMWAARQIAKKLRTQIPRELDALALWAEMSPTHADNAGVAILQRVLDPVLRPKETSVALVALCDEMEARAKRRAGKLDDALVIVLRGALNC
ncbi:MAG TPA: hypothetical protein PLU87_19005 [Sedimentisphaerales bacterium]|nr:hypothetical protein [Sedimentisphaerales bacterium]HRS13208.1 hypothetical protein [Sedimentisphaerales bacterium]